MRTWRDGQSKLDLLGMHLGDNLGAANEALREGEITREQWIELLDAFAIAWEKFREIAGFSIHDATQRILDDVCKLTTQTVEHGRYEQ